MIDGLFELASREEPLKIEVDLEAQQLVVADAIVDVEIDSFRKHCLINGLDDIGLTLQYVDDIKAYEERRRQQAPWLFADQ